MNDTATGSSAPIPNDDPRCHCAIDKDEEGIRFEGADPRPTVTVSIHGDCPLHGEATRAIMRGTLGRMSINR